MRINRETRLNRETKLNLPSSVGQGSAKPLSGVYRSESLPGGSRVEPITATLPLLHNLPHQKEVWNKMVYGEVDRAILIWHRRAGKDITSFQILTEWATEKAGLYWYIFPYYAQAKKSFWEAFVNPQMKYIDLIPKSVIKKVNNNEMKFELWNGSIIRLVGADNPDALVGSNPNGVVISEFALINPNLWQIILEPILLRNGGKVIFNSTPRGENHCYEMFKYLNESQKTNKKHYASILKA